MGIDLFSLKPFLKFIFCDQKKSWPPVGADVGVLFGFESPDEVLHFLNIQLPAGFYRMGLTGQDCRQLVLTGLPGSGPVAVQQLMQSIFNGTLRICISHAHRNRIN